MLKKSLAILMFAPVLAIAGENGGVLEKNYNVGLSYGWDQDTDTLGISGGINLPVYRYVGSSFYLRGSRTEVDGADVKIDNYQLASSIYLRDFDLGKIEAGLSYHQAHMNNLIDGDDSFEAYLYSLSGQYYLNDFTFGASRLFADSKNTSTSHLAFADIAWYWQNNTKLLVSAGGMDAKDSYSLRVSHQPDYFKNSTAFSFGYNWDHDDDSYSISVNYYFDTLVSLKDRDRKYR